MTVLENVMEAPIQVLGLSKAEARERAIRYLEKWGLMKGREVNTRLIFLAVSNSECPSPVH